MKYTICCFLILFMNLSLFGKDFIVSYREGESATDTRFLYPLELIQASLEATKSKYGNYKLVPVHRFNNKRAQNPDYISTLENFIFDSSISLEREQNLLSVKIPTSKGIYGYRVFLIDKKNQPIFDNIKTIDDLKKISFGQADGWLDSQILKDAGFNVILGNNYDGLFAMLNAGLFQAFPRGINEAYREVEQTSKTFPNIVVEKNLCIYYPLPRYFYTSKENTLLAERMEKGLNIIMGNNIFDKIWTKYNYPSVEKSNLSKRKIFYIKNLYLPKDIPITNKNYLYIPK